MRYSQAVPALIALCLGSALAQQHEAPIVVGYDHGKPIYFTPGFYTLADGLAEAQRTGKHVLILYDSFCSVHLPTGEIRATMNFDYQYSDAISKLAQTCVIVRLDPNAPMDKELHFGGYPQFLVLERTGKILAGQSDHNRLPDLVAKLGSLAEASQMFAQDLNSAFEEARAQDKPVLVNFTPGFYTLADGLAEAQRTGKHVLILYDSFCSVHLPTGEIRATMNFDYQYSDAISKLAQTCVIVRLDPNAPMDKELHFGGYPQFLVLERTGKILAGQSDHNRLPDLVAKLGSLAEASQMFAQDLNSAFEEARAQDKPVLVNVYTSDLRSFVPQPESWCTVEVAYVPRGAPVGVPPQLPDATILGEVRNLASLSDPAVASRIQQDFIACEVDGSQERGFMQRYRVVGYPTLLFLSPEGEEIVRLQGAVKPEQILATASEALASYRQGKTAEPLIPWEDPLTAFERAERENKPVFLVKGDLEFAHRIEALSRTGPRFLQALRDDFVCLHLVGSGRDTFSSSYSDHDTEATFYPDHQPWIVRVNGKQMPEQEFEITLKLSLAPLSDIPEKIGSHLYGTYGTFVKRPGDRVVQRVTLGESGISWEVLARGPTVYYLYGQPAHVLSDMGYGGQGGYEVFVLDPQGEPLLETSGFEERGRDWTSPAFYETLTQGALRLWYGEDGFGIKDLGTALTEARRTNKRVFLVKQLRGASSFETYTLFDELRDALEQLGYIPALINTASWRMIDFPEMGRIPEWRAWMELEMWNKLLIFSGWPACCVLASNGSLVGDPTGPGSPSVLIAGLQAGGLGSYPREMQVVHQMEQDIARLQQAVAQGDWAVVEEYHQSRRAQVSWSNVEGPYKLVLRPPGNPAAPSRIMEELGYYEMPIPTELGKRLRERQIGGWIDWGPVRIEGQGRTTTRRTTNTQGQEVIEIDIDAP
ncbi:MAG: thioredoxin family protein [Chloroflexota bacterium]